MKLGTEIYSWCQQDGNLFRKVTILLQIFYYILEGLHEMYLRWLDFLFLK